MSDFCIDNNNIIDSDSNNFCINDFDFGKAALIKPVLCASAATIASPLIIMSRPALFGITLNSPAITMNGHIPRFISGAVKVTLSKAYACDELHTKSNAPA